MSHDKLKLTARKRMATTGEPYAAARRAVIRQHQEALQDEHRSEAARRRAYDVVAEQLTSYGQMVRRQLTHPASGIDEIQQRFAALQWFRGLGHSGRRSARRAGHGHRPSTVVVQAVRQRSPARRCWGLGPVQRHRPVSSRGGIVVIRHHVPSSR